MVVKDIWEQGDFVDRKQWPAFGMIVVELAMHWISELKSEVQVLGAQRMRGTAKWWAGPISMRLLVVSR